MNLLIYVTALLLSLSALSYQSLSRFQSQSAKEKLWDRRIRVDTVCTYNEAIDDLYKDSKKSEKSESEGSTGENKIAAYAKMNLHYLVDSKFAQEKPEETKLYESIALRLIQILYSEQTFYHNALQINPQLLDQLFPMLREANAKLKSPLTGATSIVNIPLGDETIRSFWINIATRHELMGKANAALDHEEACNGVRFTQFVDSKGSKIKIYLASPALLLAIYESKEIVDQILEKRTEIYKRLKRGETADTAGQEFQSLFQGRSGFDVILDFNVSKTNPND